MAPTDTTVLRRRWAEATLVLAGCDDARLRDAFAAVAREDFVGPPPWRVLHGPARPPTITADPAQLYQDALVALAHERGINNGQPSLHACCLATVAPQPGETAIHVGAGTGFYTALLAELVGPQGRVIGYEIEADLAARAKANLAHWPQAEVRSASGTATALPQADVIYVSAGATHPVAAWLDALRIGGRLVFPLTPDMGRGCMLLVTRRGADRYAARALLRVAFVPCAGARDAAASASVAAAVEGKPLDAVRSLRRGGRPDASAWAAGDGWWLSTAGA